MYVSLRFYLLGTGTGKAKLKHALMGAIWEPLSVLFTKIAVATKNLGHDKMSMKLVFVILSFQMVFVFVMCRLRLFNHVFY